MNMRLFPLCWLLCACPSPSDTETDEPAGPELSDVPTGGCGADDYDWIDPTTLGEVVTWERAPELDTTAVVLRGLLSTAGYPIEWLPLTHDVVVYRMRFVTQDRGERVESTALVSFPDTTGPFPTVAWLHGTTGFSDSCAPSANGLAGAAVNLLFSSLGAVVVAPDYLGMNGFGDPSDMLHPYIIAEPTAVASLDSIRAAWAAREADTSIRAEATATTVLFGASEGGFAALWTERYAPYYLPEADIIATVASVPPSDLLGLTAHGLETLGETTGAVAAVLTAHHDWYGYDQPLSDIIEADIAAALPTLMHSECGAGGLFDDVTETTDVYSESAIDGALAEDWDALGDFACGLSANSLASAPFPRVSTGPVLYVISGEDELVWHETNRDDVPRLCDAEYDLDVIECAGAAHAMGAVSSLHLQWQWVENRIAGEPTDGICGLPTPIVCEETAP